MAWVVSACVLACCAAEKPPAGPDTREAGWRSLFNGKDLAGWEPQGKAHWRVEDGVIVGTQDGNPSLSGLLTTKEGELESQTDLLKRIDEAAKFMPMEHLALSPQCGFASVAQGNLLSWDDQRKKLALVVSTARKAWG